jgi:uncharacterized membrane protein
MPRTDQSSNVQSKKQRASAAPGRAPGRESQPRRVPEKQAPTEALATATAEPNQKRAAALGWFSLGLGLAQLLAPRQVARLIGADEDDSATCLTLRLIGGRELVCGLGLLSQSHPVSWAWARVAGDLMDLSLLGKAWQARGAQRDRLLLAGGGVLGAAYVDVRSALRLQQQGDVAMEGIEVHHALTIARPPEEVYAFFRDFQNLPRFMVHLESVSAQNGHSHWCAVGPLGARIEWDAEIVEDRPGELIVWRSAPNADIANQGRVQFRAVGPDTELDVVLRSGVQAPSASSR